jgi:hypothetical protein
MTGWSYTKVNRLLTEGRRAFLRRVSGIQRGADCERYEPLLSALADGEASAEDLETLRPHMRTCLSCRAALREFRAAPDRVAGLLPPAALLASDGGPVRNLFESVLGAAQHKTAAMGDRLHAAAELATGQKVAAVAASAAALAGGGTAVDEFANHQGPPVTTTEQVEAKPVKEEVPIAPSPAPAPAPTEPDPAGSDPAAAPAPAPEPPPAPPPSPATEFTPGASAQAAAPPPAPAMEPGGGGFAPAGGGGGGSGEFAP